MAKNIIQVDGVSILMIESWFGPFVAHARRPEHVALSLEVLQDAAFDRDHDTAAIPGKLVQDPDYRRCNIWRVFMYVMCVVLCVSCV